MRSTKKQGEGIIIARGGKKASGNQTLLWARKKNKGVDLSGESMGHVLIYRDLSSHIRPLIPNDLSEGEQMQQIRNE